MAQLQSLQSAALLSLAIWYRGNKLMSPPGMVHIQNPLAGSFWDRLKDMSGEDDTDELARKLLGFNHKVTGVVGDVLGVGGTPMPFSLSGDDQENLRRLVDQIEEDAMAGNIFMPSPGGTTHISTIPKVFHWNFESERGPYMSHRAITSGMLRTANNRRPAPRRTTRRRRST